MAAILWTALGALVVLSTTDYAMTARFLGTAERVNHSHEVLENLARLLAAVTDCETGQRGYVITGEARYLQP